MGRKLQTIYEYLSDYSVQEIDDLIYNLSNDEKVILKNRYGDDLHNPQSTDDFNKEISQKFYKSLIPKMKRILAQPMKLSESIEILEVEESKKAEEVEEKVEVIDKTTLLMQLLKKGIDNREMCKELNISEQQLYQELLNLKNNGILCSRKYYSNGSIKYKTISSMKDLNTYMSIGQGRTIITDYNEDSLKCLVISDLHFGSELERLDLVDRAYNYCIKNGINIILCGGDLIDGCYSKGNQNITDLYQQIKYFIEKYPYDKNILTFSVAGDHDMSVFRSLGLDIIEMCNNYRHDVIIGGYNNTAINLKNDKVHLFHHTCNGHMRKTSAPIVLHGHSHKYSTEMKGNKLHVTIPTLSNIIQPMPSALELNLDFKKGYIVKSVIKHLYFDSQDIVLSEAKFNLLKGRKIDNESVNNTEKFKQEVISPPVEAKCLKKTL